MHMTESDHTIKRSEDTDPHKHFYNPDIYSLED